MLETKNFAKFHLLFHLTLEKKFNIKGISLSKKYRQTNKKVESQKVQLIEIQLNKKER